MEAAAAAAMEHVELLRELQRHAEREGGAAPGEEAAAAGVEGVEGVEAVRQRLRLHRLQQEDRGRCLAQEATHEAADDPSTLSPALRRATELLRPGAVFTGVIKIPGLRGEQDSSSEEDEMEDDEANRPSAYRLEILERAVDGLGRTYLVAHHEAYGDKQACYIRLEETKGGGSAPDAAAPGSAAGGAAVPPPGEGAGEGAADAEEAGVAAPAQAMQTAEPSEGEDAAPDAEAEEQDEQEEDEAAEVGEEELRLIEESVRVELRYSDHETRCHGTIDADSGAIGGQVRQLARGEDGFELPSAVTHTFDLSPAPETPPSTSVPLSIIIIFRSRLLLRLKRGVRMDAQA